MKIVLISDSTGETITASANAVISQFKDIEPEKFLFPFIRSKDDLAFLSADFLRDIDLVLITVVDRELKAQIEMRCAASAVRLISVLDPLLDAFSAHLSQLPDNRPGKQYEVDKSYFDRITSLDFAMGHDDGQSAQYFSSADVVLIGVSRTSKTPTCIYLAYQGIKAANIPIIPDGSSADRIDLVAGLGVPMIGLTARASRLYQVRSTRLKVLEANQMPTYTDIASIEEELVAARLLFDKYRIPVIDVTRRSIEETAASIRNILKTGHTA